MIRSFADAETEKVFRREVSRKLPIDINDHWRVCFAWQDGDAYRVEIVDYHR